MLVRGGQMLIGSINSKSMKDWAPVDVDVKKLTASSVLLEPELFSALPPQAQRDIDAVISQQARDVETGALNPTNLVISGGVTTVIVADEDRRDRTDVASSISIQLPAPRTLASPRRRRLIFLQQP